MISWNDPGFGDPLRWLPGKSTMEGMWLPAWRHMLDCGLVMQRLFHQWIPGSVRRLLEDGLSEEEAEQYAILAALLHDMGKLTPVFASKLLGMLPEVRDRIRLTGLPVQAYESIIDPGKSPHALVGAAWLRRRGCPHSLTAVIAAHHGKPASSDQVALLDADEYPYGQHLYGSHGAGSSQGRLWDEMRQSWLDYALSSCNLVSLDKMPEINRRAQMVLTGLLIVADWIASNTAYFPLLSEDETPEPAVEAARADAALEALALPFPLVCDMPPLNTTDFAERFGFAPRPLQQTALEAARRCVNPGLMIIEAQMGVGKTEAALAAAEHFAQKSGAGGLFVALPTQATANGIFPRLLSWAEPLTEAYQQAVKLAHGTANMNQVYMELPRRASPDADGLVVHPWMEGRKKSLLANVVIGTVDQLLMAALKQKHVMLRHLGLAGKVVIIDECHAYDAYMSVYLERALQWLGSYQVPVIMLSATLPAARRAALTAAYLGKTSAPADRNGLIVVATQVVEQSLDIDADVMITELCPMDLLLQRVGRLHRHHRVRPPELEEACCAVLPAAGGTHGIYGDWLLQQTERLLPAVITLPADIPALVQDTYAQPAADMSDDPAWHSHVDRLADQERRASSFRLPKCEERRRPRQNTINTMLDTDAADNETYGDAAVRDGRPSIEVLLLVQYQDGSVGLAPRNGDAPCFDPTREPSREDAMRIARQRIRLPHALCPRAGDAIAALESLTCRALPEWQQASALRGELFLLLDDQMKTTMGDYTLQYDPEYGLRYWKEACGQDG